MKHTLHSLGVLPSRCARSTGGHEGCSDGHSSDCIPMPLPWLPHEEDVPQAA